MGDKRVLLIINSANSTAVCPVCQNPSNRVHSRYTRSLADLPWADLSVRLLLKVRRFLCLNSNCHRTTFAERLGEAVAVYARRTTRLSNQLYQIAMAVGGKAGARLTTHLGIATSADSLLRTLKRVQLPSPPTPRVLGVDDWAWKKSESYGSILVDLERHQPVDLLPDRKETTFAVWLDAHPGVEIISRDRAGSYAMAARRSAPDAIQVADRFHVLKNLGESVERVIQRNYSQVQQVLLTKASRNSPVASTLTNQNLPLKWHTAQKEARFERRKALYDQVQSLKQAGYNLSEISEELEISRRRARVLLQGPPTMKRVIRPTKIEPYKAYLRQRFFEDGCHNAMQLWREVKEQGYEGGRTWLLNYVTQLRQQLVEPDTERTGVQATTQPKPLSDFLYSPRQLTLWFIKDKSELRLSQ